VSQTIPNAVGCLSVITGDFEAMTREFIAVIVCNRDLHYHLKALRCVAVNLHRDSRRADSQLADGAFLLFLPAAIDALDILCAVFAMLESLKSRI
jgi:hypothetical protein